MERFPVEILLNIFQHLTLYSQRQCLEVCRLWRAAALHLTTDNNSYIELNSINGIAWLDKVDKIRQLRLNMISLSRAYEREELACYLKSLPNLADICVASDGIMRILNAMNVTLPKLETIRSTDAWVYSTESYSTFTYRHRKTIHSLYLQQHPQPSQHKVLEGGLHKFKCLKYLTIDSPSIIVFDEIISACPQLQRLKIIMRDEDGFRVVRFATDEHFNTTPITKLETLCVSGAIMSRELYRYLYRYCGYLSHLQVTQESSFDSLSRVFDAFDPTLPLSITTFSCNWYSCASNGLLKTLCNYWPRLDTVQILQYRIEYLADDDLNATLDFGTQNLVYLSLKFFDISESPADIPIVLKIITSNATIFYQKERLHDADKHFERHGGGEGSESDNQPAIITIKASSVHSIRFHAFNDDFDQLIHLKH